MKNSLNLATTTEQGNEKYITISYANVREQAHNTLYPNIKKIVNADELAAVLKFDHAAGEFKNNKRLKENFLYADCIIMDCDNDSEDESKWINPKDIKDRLPGVEFYTCYSRNHMKQKGDKKPRPKFHIYFILYEVIRDASKICEIKEKLLKVIPELDAGAKDAARFIYGVVNPEIKYFAGDKDIITFLNENYQNNEADLFTSQENDKRTEHKTSTQSPKNSTIHNSNENSNGDIIPEGTRNSTLYKHGIHYYLICDEAAAKKLFWQDCLKCVPMLENSEMARIWDSVKSSNVAILKKIALEKGNKEKFLKWAESKGVESKYIEKVTSAVFDREILDTLNSRAISLLLKYKNESKAREKFLIEANKHIDALGMESIMGVFENAKKSDFVQLSNLAREFKDNPDEYNKKAAGITSDKDKISKIWDKENGDKSEQTAARESQSLGVYLGRKQKMPIDIRIVEKTLKELGIKLQLNVITQKIEVSNIPRDNPYVLESFHDLPEIEQKNAAVDMLPGILYPILIKNFSVNLSLLKSYIGSIAATHRFNPVADMFKSQEWDGQDRLAEIYKIMGISDNSMYCRLVKKWLIQCVAMALNDEGKYNCEIVLLLQGKQGIGKSEFFRNIGMRRPDWVKLGVDIDLRDKDSKIQATTGWIEELGEIEGIFKREQAQLKNFITAYYTELRLPYAEREKQYSRRCSFGATVNQERYIKDTEGGTRRWATIRVNHIDSAKMRELSNDWYIQMWAQVYKLFLENPDYYRLDTTERAFIEKENQSASEFLPGELELLDYLDWEADISRWQYMNASQFIFKAKLTRLNPVQIGKAIKKIRGYENRIKEGHGRVYLLPPLKNMDYIPLVRESECEPESQEIQENLPVKESEQESYITAEEFCKMELLPKKYEDIITMYQQMPESEKEKIYKDGKITDYFQKINPSNGATNMIKFQNALRAVLGIYIE